MDPTKAVQMLGFPSGSSLNDITIDDIQRRFILKMHQANSFHQDAGIKLSINEDVQISKRRHSVAVSSFSTQNSKQLRVPDHLDTRILHEAFQCLTRKKRGHRLKNFKLDMSQIDKQST